MEGAMEIVGIDIAKRKFDLAWIAAATGKKRSKVFDNTEAGFADLLRWLSKQGIAAQDCHVAMEATSRYYEELALALFEAGCTVSVVNPLQIKRFGESQLIRQKTDRADAELIAQFCQQCKPRAWQPPPMEVRELQRLIARLEAVQDMHVQEQNRRYESQGAMLESVERISGSLKDEEEHLRKLIQDHIDHHPGLREKQDLLRSIPGIGATVSSYVIAWLQADRFDDVRQAVAFVGLSPRHRESGDSLRGKSRVCKLGHGRLRKILYLPAMAAVRCNPAAIALSDRLKESGKRGKVVIVAVMRKLVHWMMAVLKSGTKFDPQLALAKS
jgi:transposase